MRVWRVKRRAHASDLSGVGGLRASARWHHRGHPVLYTSEAPALAVLECLVHVDPASLPADLRLIEIDVPDVTSIEVCDPEALTRHWKRVPGPKVLRDFGTAWLAAKRTALLKVPSALVPAQFNYVLNPEHAEAKRIRVAGQEPFSFDPRLFK
jgi:RES domain-containing protein